MKNPSDYHAWVVEANLADIHGWRLLDIRPGRVDHLNVVHLLPCTTSTFRERERERERERGASNSIAVTFS